VNWAEDHLFDRRSIAHEHVLWRHAIEFARGHRVALAEIKLETEKRPYIRETPGKLTRGDVLAREWEIVQLAKNGARARAPLAQQFVTDEESLAEDQKIAFRQILGSPSTVVPECIRTTSPGT
jgi:hypothetical protein